MQNIYSGDSKVSITCEFSDVPAILTLMPAPKPPWPANTYLRLAEP